MAAKAVDVVSRSMMDAFIRRAEATLPVISEPESEPEPDALPPPAVVEPVAATPGAGFRGRARLGHERTAIITRTGTAIRTAMAGRQAHAASTAPSPSASG